MLLTLTLAAALFGLQVLAYHVVTSHVRRRAHYRARLATLVVTYRPWPTVAPHAHNRPGDN